MSVRFSLWEMVPLIIGVICHTEVEMVDGTKPHKVGAQTADSDKSGAGPAFCTYCMYRGVKLPYEYKCSLIFLLPTCLDVVLACGDK